LAREHQKSRKADSNLSLPVSAPAPYVLTQGLVFLKGIVHTYG
jgi:hypothetical protein